MISKEKSLQTYKVLSVFALTMIIIAGIVNLRNLPIIASVGFSSVFFYILAALIFLIPSALVCTELTSMMPQAGGVYLWSREAFGKKMGFFTIWSQWFNSIISFPATLSFIAVTLAYIFIPKVDNHKIVLFSIMMIIIWGCTLFNFFGIKASSRLNIVGALVGSIVPALIIILLSLVWIKGGHSSQINISWHNLFPSLRIKNVVFFISVLNGYSGIQIIAFHAQNVINPRKNFPRGIIIAIIAIIVITIFGSLAIAMVVPNKQLHLVSGIMDSFFYFFREFNMSWALPILALLIAVSGISSVSAWFLAPARGFAQAAKHGLFPKWCSVENRHGMPCNVLILQAVLATLLSSVFLFIAKVNTAFWLLVVLTSQFTLAMYIVIFAAVIRLRYKRKDLVRHFKIPGGKLGLWLIPGFSIVFCLLGIILGYFPPESLKIKSLWKYEAFLIVGNFIYIVIPIIIYLICRKKK